MVRPAPGQPKREKKHNDTRRDMIAASPHVFSSISRGGTQWVYGGRLFIVSARTNKRHHHQVVAEYVDSEAFGRAFVMLERAQGWAVPVVVSGRMSSPEALSPRLVEILCC